MSETETRESGTEAPKSEIAGDRTGRELPAAAKRALAEAEARRAAQVEAEKAEAEETASKEIGGPQGPDPIRYGDWEKGGIASDF